MDWRATLQCNGVASNGNYRKRTSSIRYVLICYSGHDRFGIVALFSLCSSFHLSVCDEHELL